MGEAVLATERLILRPPVAEDLDAHMELLNTPADSLLHRLFWQYPFEQVTTQDVLFGCTCSPQKVANMVKMLGMDEACDMIDEDNRMEVGCDFCGQTYVLSGEQVRALSDPAAEIKPQLH